MDYRYYYDDLEYTGTERRDRRRRRVREVAAAGVVATALASAGHALGIVDGEALALPCTLAALVSLALHRPVVRLLRSDGRLMKAVGTR